MRISDWSSDVCSSDLLGAERDTALGRCDLQDGRLADRAFKESTAIARNASGLGNAGDLPARSQAARLHYLVGEDVHRSAAREPHRILKRADALVRHDLDAEAFADPLQTVEIPAL